MQALAGMALSKMTDQANAGGSPGYSGGMAGKDWSQQAGAPSASGAFGSENQVSSLLQEPPSTQQNPGISSMVSPTSETSSAFNANMMDNLGYGILGNANNPVGAVVLGLGGDDFKKRAAKYNSNGVGSQQVAKSLSYF